MSVHRPGPAGSAGSGGTGGSGGDAVGSVADEAAKLFALLGERGREHAAAASAAGGGSGPCAEPPGAGSPGAQSAGAGSAGAGSAGAGSAGAGSAGAESVGGGAAPHGESCRWCPICQAIGFVRDTSPEVREQLVASAGAFVVALRELLDQAGRAPAQRSGARSPGAAVEHIDVSQQSEDEPWV